MTADLAAALFTPRSVALVGASADPAKASSRPLRFLRRSGFAGAVYPVNRRAGTIDGEPAFPSLDALPEVPDHAFLMTPTAATVEAVGQCGRLGVPVVTVLSGGFAEAGPEGAARQRELAAVAAESGIRVLGPSSLGLVNTRTGLTLTANAAFAEPDLPRGGIFVASHSGSLIGALLSRGAACGAAFSHLVSVGGEVDLGIGEICGAAVADPDVTGFLLFLENLRHADRLRAFAREAAAHGKPVLAYKLGRSRTAAELAVSHTGSLAGEDDVAAAFLADCGIARAHTLDGLLEGLPLLARTPVRTGTTPRVGVVTTTGGGAAMVVDQLGVLGVEVAGPSPATLVRLAEAGAPAAPGAIVDLTLAGTRYAVMAAALDVLHASGEFDLVVAVVGSSARFEPEVAVRPIVDRADRGGLAAFLVPHAPEALAMLADAGVPAFRTPESCADAIAAALGRRPPRAVPPPPPAGPGPTRPLDEAASYAVLAELGVVAAPHRVVPVDDVETTGLEFPVAVKALSSALGHKSDVGGVVLGVETPAGVGEAAREIQAAVAGRGGVEISDVLVQSMADGLGEVLVGYRVDAGVGPLVLVAAGGVLTEVYADRSLRPAPVDLDTVRRMLAEVKGLAALRGHRGAQPGDLDALARLVVAVSELAGRADVAEAEINPVLVRPAGEGVVALDAVVRLFERPAGEP
ncbi:6-carboxyhexanoate-CoA ligase [Amycolatopsis mediterranei S699]|uniref:6-carboxyhexanoate-CoA ligase n=4 Tax=Amycolatopsis mediterranei TaxID=33910 RepID=A0A0H3D3Q2_AMYMU|nr:acetate--CoA ligase [Amycolatopsis mediterranei]ADJ45620.1 6-carboxyhexanoate-CoA ligase [Amycolatopsis mediterranei U32]AEK42399.1 6-carboxyhexanoate-CoA ligase [Amycolatopsis mediterranei S699]AFO77332.1 6-carboxyhexanoate-CoA ligase [Amycolatopsis mediterranei S699]AGT84460.1 6-carboxyhexanoate-CoA ligase [Amycolatopsis mediterranei RB]KDO05876.1 6-carboxyhexanoate--CoA ligase [Amycolatopsis mediterranei]